MRITSLVFRFAAAALFVVPMATHAAPNSVVGRYDTTANAHDVIVVGNYAYVADEGFGIVVLNVSDPANPTLVGSYTTGITDAWQIDIDGTKLYVVGSNSSTLTVLSIANPTTPSLLSSYTDSSMTVRKVASAGSYVYIVGLQGAQETVKVLDVTAMTQFSPPVAVGSIAVHHFNDIRVSGNYVYVVGGKTLDILTAYSPSTPMTNPGTYTSPNNTASYLGLQVFGSVAYINSAATGLTTVSIADPAAPTLINNFPGVYGGGVAVSNGYVFLGEYYTGSLSIYDIASTGTPVYVTTILGTGNGFGVTIANDYAYIADGTSGVAIMDVSKPDTVAPVVTPIGAIDPVIPPGGTYADPGVTVADNIGGTGTVVSGTVDTTKVGKYTLTYTVTDRAGNTSVVTRTVIVGPSVEKLTLKNNTYTLKIGKKSVVLKPFPSYRGAVLGRKLIVNTKTDPFYVFIATDAMRKPELVMYNASGKQVTRYNLTSISAKGLQLAIVPNPATLSVFIAVAPKTNGLTATIVNISKSGLKSLKTVTAAKGTGTVVMAWLKGYTNEYVLATLVKGKTGTPYVWRYNGSKKSFIRDTKFVITRLSWTKTSVKLK